MDDFDRLRSEETPEPQPPPPHEPLTPSRTPWIVGLAVVVALAAGVWWWTSRPSTTEEPTATNATGPASAAVPDSPGPLPGLGVGAPDPNLPPLSELDAYLRPLMRVLSARPELASLLATDDLLRRFVVSVENITRGVSPTSQVRVVAPKGPFVVSGPPGATVIAPASYARYDGLVRMITDLDPDDLARLYGRLKPRLEEAHAELGVPGTFDESITRALRHLLATPEIPAAARVRPSRGINYVYEDASIEGLSAAQRQILRLGPERAAHVKAQLRRFALALGIPAERLTE